MLSVGVTESIELVAHNFLGSKMLEFLSYAEHIGKEHTKKTLEDRQARDSNYCPGNN